MGLFSRNKGQQAQQPPQAAAPAAASPTPSVHRPDGSQLSQSQFQQQLFHQHYQSLQPQQQNSSPQQLQHLQGQQQQQQGQQHGQQLGQQGSQHQPQPHQSPTSQPNMAPLSPNSPLVPSYGSPSYAQHPYAQQPSYALHPYTGQPHPYMPQVMTAVPMVLDPRAAASYGMPPGAGGGTAGSGSTALLYEAAQRAAASGKPLTLDFVGQLQPPTVAANRQYGITMPHEHPYGPPPPLPVAAAGGSTAAEPPLLPPGWRPGLGQNPYDSIRIPALPDMRSLPPELQDFRDQCATGVRQAVAMITAMEHQLWWERSRRQQAEEDCKVLLAAVHTERGLAESLAAANERRRREAAEAGAKLTLAADELPQASEAATTIQKHVRGRLARKEFESHLRDILRGVDPALDPAALPPAAASHVSHVNTSGAPRRLGLRQLLGDLEDREGPPGAGGGFVGGSGGTPGEAAAATAYYRRQVERIGQRLAGHKDAGEPHPGDTSGDPLQADVKQLLSGTYPASSAQVIAALVRRCRELQAALLEAAGELEEARLSVQGLRDANSRLTELAEVRADLEAARHDNLRLAGTVAKLRAVLAAGAARDNADAAAENPFVAAWYRKAYADREWQRVPPGGPGGVALMDGPDSAVETWDALRASLPEPVLVPRVESPGRGYKDLMQLKQDMIAAARRGPPDPLYSSPVPDTSGFVYERDTPLMPMQSAAPLIRESLPPDAFVGLHEDLPRRTPPRPSGPGTSRSPSQRGSAAGTPVQPGSLLPSSAIRSHSSPHGSRPSGPPLGRGDPDGLSNGGAAAGGGGGGDGSEGGGGGGGDGAYSRLVEQQERLRAQAEWEARQQYGSGGGGGGGLYGVFGYNRDTPVVPVYSVLPLIREDDYVRRSMSPGRDASPPRTPPPPSPPPGTPQSAPVSRPPSSHRQMQHPPPPYQHTNVSQSPPYPQPYPQPQPHPSVAAVGAAAMTLPHSHSQLYTQPQPQSPAVSAQTLSHGGWSAGSPGAGMGAGVGGGGGSGGAVPTPVGGGSARASSAGAGAGAGFGAGFGS